MFVAAFLIPIMYYYCMYFITVVARRRFLREAYVCDGSLCLFANNSIEELQDSGALYLRSDDSQRTVMSGQVSFLISEPRHISANALSMQISHIAENMCHLLLLEKTRESAR